MFISLQVSVYYPTNIPGLAITISIVLCIQYTLNSYCCLCILIVVYIFLDAATLTEVFPCFFFGCKANARV